MNRKEEEEASFQSPMVKTQMFWVRCVCAKRRTKLWKREKERTARTGIHTRQIKPGRTGAPLLGKGQLDCPFHPLLTHHCNSFLLPRVCNASQLLLTTGALIPFHEVWGYPHPVTLCTCVPFIALSKSSSLNSASLLSPKPDHQVLKYRTPRHIQATKKPKAAPFQERHMWQVHEQEWDYSLPAPNQL